MIGARNSDDIDLDQPTLPPFFKVAGLELVSVGKDTYKNCAIELLHSESIWRL